MIENYSVPKKQSWLTWFFRGILIIAIFIIFARLAELQVIKGEYYENLSDGNRARRVAIKAPRGKILARNGEILVESLPIEKTVVFDPLQGYEKVLANDETDPEDIIIEWQRHYPLGTVVGHITGYLGEVNQEELGKVDQDCLVKGTKTLGTLIGRSGLEYQYDCLLRGVDGEEIVEVDTKGSKIRTLGRKSPDAGSNLLTNIDYKLQKKTADAMGENIGAVVMTNINGELLAVYSSPSYDPNVFANSDRNADLGELFSDKKLPLFNRAIGGVYHPGSIYKIVTSTASMMEEAIKPDYEYEDTGVIRIDEYEYNNWYFTQYGGQEGYVDTVQALARSTDTFYYKVGELVGVDAMVDWTKRFGLADKTDVDLPGEVTGLVPSPEWKKAVKGERWYLGNTYHLSIGQGDLTVTPLASHNIASVVATGGKLCRPYLNSNLEPSCNDLGIKPQFLETIKQGMKAACEPGGTGSPFFDFFDKTGVEVGCKTGTAETFEEDVTHAWFTIFAPYENPEYIITVLVEKGGEGSKVAAPVAREILDYVYNP